jgi:hypothetical protein
MLKKQKLEPISVNEIFNKNHSYKIPIYQRNYSWTEKEIAQLIEDINDNEDGYYLGNLIVDGENDCFEVIDGQQRLTTLYIIYKSLKIDIKMYLSFGHRKNSKETLNNLTERNESEEWNKSIYTAYNIINTIWDTKIVNNSPIKRESFIDKLKNSKLLQIQVPKNTDLNHYFEIMNTRGEQLEKVDIVKSNLMEDLEPEKREEFACIWDICSNMNEYVVKSSFLIRKENNFYKKYFGLEKERFVWKDCSILDKKKYNVKEKSLATILNEKELNKPNDDNQVEGHYESLIQFPEFLLHTLNLMEGNIYEHLNKEKLLERFFPKEPNKKIDSEKFIIELLKYRFFYDMYIGRVKAGKEDEDDPSEDKDGIFDIREPIVGSKNIYTRNTFKDKNVRAIQWALRITYTSQKSMHWVTEMLDFVNNSKKISDLSDFEKLYFAKSRTLIKKYVEETGLYDSENNKINEEILNKGVETPHIIFAYLDYLLQEKVPVDSSNYYYRFRTSVEHLYPQKSNHEGITDEIVNKDDFGNLFLLTRETNSFLSNDSPESKFFRMEKSRNEKGKGFTPKLEHAYNIYKDSDKKWDNDKIITHKHEVVELLKENLTN